MENLSAFFSNYTLTLAITHILVAIVMFFIINWIGAKSVSVGYLQMSMVIKDESYPAFNFLFKAIAPVILMVLFVALVQSINCEQLVSYCYLIVVYYWIFRFFVILIYGRLSLTNWKTQILYWIASIGLSIYLYKIIDKVDVILPDPEALRDEMWILIILFLYSVINNMVFDREGTLSRKDNYIKHTHSHLKAKYNKIVSKECNNLFFIQMVYSIMIYENFNRPKIIRWIEYGRFLLTRKPHTLGIMQVTSSKWINDEQSIRLAINKIQSDTDEIMNNYANNKEEFSLFSIVCKVAGKYNKDDDYVNEVEQIFSTISDSEKTSQAFYSKYNYLKLNYDKNRFCPFYFNN
jgi:hypothetical protein